MARCEIVITGQDTQAEKDAAYRLAKIFQAIVKERAFQTEKYGPVLPEHPHLGVGPGGHELGAWLVIAESELEEAKKALIHGGNKTPGGRDNIRSELVQLAAVCVAALEQHGLEEV